MPGTDNHSKASGIKPDSAGAGVGAFNSHQGSNHLFRAVCVLPGRGTHKSAPPLLPSLVPWKVSWRAPTRPPINNKRQYIMSPAIQLS